MITLSHGLLADLPADRPVEVSGCLNRTIAREVQPPAAGFTHNGKLNMAPAIWVAATLGIVGWSGVFGIGYLVAHYL